MIQEVQLARHLTFWLDVYPLSLPLIRQIKENIFKEADPYLRYACPRKDYHYHGYLYSDYDMNYKADVLTLLDRFRSKKCANPRDRVFSLLSISSVSSGVIPVDYSISLSRLAYLVLSHHQEHLCLCTIALVVKALDIKNGILNNEPSDIQDAPWLEFEITVPNSKIVSWRTDTSLAAFAAQSVCDLNSYLIPYWPRGIGLGKSHKITCDSNGKGTFRLAFWWIFKLHNGVPRMCNKARVRNHSSPRVRIGWGDNNTMLL